MKALILIVSLVTILLGCGKNDSSGNDKTTDVKAVPITAQSSKLAQTIAGYKWCGVATYYAEEGSEEYRTIYHFNQDGTAIFDEVKDSDNSVVESKRAFWSATEKIINIKGLVETIKVKAKIKIYQASSYLVIKQDDNTDIDYYYSKCD